jgi:hypothetical protein
VSAIALQKTSKTKQLVIVEDSGDRLAENLNNKAIGYCGRVSAIA